MARSTSRFKQKPAVPFGDFMLPILGVVMVGLLFVGVKYFWLVSDPQPVNIPQPRLTRSATSDKNGTTTIDATSAAKEAVSDVVIAQPVQRNTNINSVASLPVADPVQGGQESAPAPAAPQRKTQEQSPRVQQQRVTRVEPKPKREPARAQSANNHSTVRAGSINESKFIVQCGSYSDRANANTVVASLRKLGYSGVVRQASVRGKNYYRVIVAGGADRSVANEIAARIKNAGHPVLGRAND